MFGVKSTPSYQSARGYQNTPSTTGNAMFDMQATPGFAEGYDPANTNAWMGQMGNQQTQMRNQQMGQGAQSVAAGTAKAMDELAGSGGLSSGARERVQEMGQKNLMNMNQTLQTQGMNNAMNLGIQGQQMNMTGLGNEASGLNAFNQNLYNQRMGAAAAERQAQAIAAGGGGGGGLNMPSLDDVTKFGKDLVTKYNPVLAPLNLAAGVNSDFARSDLNPANWF